MPHNHEKGLCWYSDKYKLCFIGIPKCAQTSIKDAFNMDKNESNYFNLPDHVKNYALFCVLRDPIDRLVSGYLEVIKRAVIDF